MKVTGILGKINTKSGSNARGKWTAYSLGVDTKGDDEYDWFRFGFENPNVKEGSAISFEAEETKPGVWSVKKGTLTVDKTPSAAKAAASLSADPRSDSIVRQHASAVAAAVAKDLVELGVVSLPKQKNKQYDFYLELLTQITNHLFVQNRNAPSIEDLLAAGAVAPDAAGVDPEDAEDAEEEDDDMWPPV